MGVADTRLSARSHLPYNVTPEQALSHPEVQRRLDISLRNLLTVTDKFLVAIISSVDQIPYVPQPQPGPGPATMGGAGQSRGSQGGQGGGEPRTPLETELQQSVQVCVARRGVLEPRRE